MASEQMGDSICDTHERWYLEQHISSRHYKVDDEWKGTLDREHFQGIDAWTW